jgi:hypothetical protein
MLEGIWPSLKQPLTLLLTFIGGSGGIVYLVDRFFISRPRLAIHRFRENFSVLDSDSGTDVIRFEAENLGEKITSLHPTVTLTAYTMEDKRVRDKAHMGGRASSARSLNPRQPETFEFFFPQTNQQRFTWCLKKYTFRLSHRAKCNVYLLQSANSRISAPRFWFELLRYKLFGAEQMFKRMNAQSRNQ